LVEPGDFLGGCDDALAEGFLGGGEEVFEKTFGVEGFDAE